MHLLLSGSSSAPAQIPARILAFGDSLTAGSVTRDLFVPYGETLRSTLGAATDVVSRGVVLESVHKMPQRLEKTLATEEQPFDAMIFLGGTNDLWRGDADAIWRSLQALYSQARARNAMLGVITLPPFDPAPMKWLEPLTGCLTLAEKTRCDVNARIRSEAEGHASDTFLVDLAAICDESAGTPLARPDGIHFEATGYQRLGDLAASAILDICARGKV